MEARGSPLLRRGGFLMEVGGPARLADMAALPAGPLEVNVRRCDCMEAGMLWELQWLQTSWKGWWGGGGSSDDDEGGLRGL